MRLLPALAGLLALAAWPAAAQQAEAGSAEIALWRAVIESNQPADYRRYLALYPEGRFAALARLRAGQMPAAGVLLRPMKPRVRLVEGVALDTEASALATGSNLRLAVMPRQAPDAIADPDRFLAESTGIGTGPLHLTIPAGPPGEDEVRLYYIPRYASTYAVAARVPVFVEPGAPGAVLARDLVREALALGPVRFEAAHRDRAMRVQGGFLRVWPGSEWNTAWFGGVPVATVLQRWLVISIGLPGAGRDEYGSTDEVVCALPLGMAALERFAHMAVGTPVLLGGVPYTWSGAGWRDPVPLLGCTLEDAG